MVLRHPSLLRRPALAALAVGVALVGGPAALIGLALIGVFENGWLLLLAVGLWFLAAQLLTTAWVTHSMAAATRDCFRACGGIVPRRGTESTAVEDWILSNVGRQAGFTLLGILGLFAGSQLAASLALGRSQHRTANVFVWPLIAIEGLSGRALRARTEELLARLAPENGAVDVDQATASTAAPAWAVLCAAAAVGLLLVGAALVVTEDNLARGAGLAAGALLLLAAFRVVSGTASTLGMTALYAKVATGTCPAPFQNTLIGQLQVDERAAPSDLDAEAQARLEDLKRTPDELLEELARYAPPDEVARVRRQVSSGTFPASYLDDLVYYRRREWTGDSGDS
jgi:hypothetical protein